jgi:hypothetical protein
VTVRFGNEYGVPILFGTRIAVWIDLDGDGITDHAEMVVVFRTNAGDAEGDGKLDFGTGTWVTVDADGDSPAVDHSGQVKKAYEGFFKLPHWRD